MSWLTPSSWLSSVRCSVAPAAAESAFGRNFRPFAMTVSDCTAGGGGAGVGGGGAGGGAAAGGAGAAAGRHRSEHGDASESESGACESIHVASPVIGEGPAACRPLS